jgi:beta-mannosidase
VQAAALQTGIEARRIRREPGEPVTDGANAVWDYCGGVAVWQFNEPWPAVSWSVMDRAGRPKAAYAVLQRSYQPLLIAARFPWMELTTATALPVEFWIVNDAPVTHQGCRAEARLDGRPVWSAADLHVRGGAAACVARVEITLSGPPEQLELALLAAGGNPLACNVYDLSVSRPHNAPPRLSALLHRLGMRLIGG